MLPLFTLEKTKNSILYEIPPGKPNPNQECTTGEDKRERVFQSGQKGASCWYYAFNFLRKRIGKNPCKELLVEREIEKICSQRRKEQTTYDNAFPISIAELYSESDMALLQSTDLKIAQLFLESKVSSSLNFSETQEDRSSLLPYIQEFINEKKHKNMFEFLFCKRASKLIELNKTFLSQVNVTNITKNKKWKQLDAKPKITALDAFVRDVSATLYKLKKSSWRPVQGIDKLLDELKEKGPLVIMGDFGLSAYIDPPFKMSQKISARDIYAWHPGAERNDSTGAGHSVVLVGAKKTHDKALVYFIDPIDPSDPLDRNKQKIYMTSFTNLTSSICSLTGKKVNFDTDYAYYGNFKI